MLPDPSENDSSVKTTMPVPKPIYREADLAKLEKALRSQVSGARRGGLR